MKIANYTTAVSAEKSVMEIQQLLSQTAKAVMVEYENSEVAAITFRIDRNGQQIGFRLPCDWKRTLKVLHADRSMPPRYKSPELAKRVAWRIVRDWLRAQLSLIEIDQVKIDQVFLPYAVTPSGETLYECLARDNFDQLALPAPITPLVNRHLMSQCDRE
jgi:hypothetical protein